VRTVLAFEPDARQAAALTRVVREHAAADIVVVETKDAALDAIRARIPDLILLTAFISPRDEGEIADLIRETDGAEHTQSLTIPMLAVGPSKPARKKKRGLLSALTGESAEPQSPAGCDPAVFGEEIVNYLQQADHRKAEAAAKKARAPKKARRKKRDADEPVAAAPAETGGSSSYWSWDAPVEPQPDVTAVEVDPATLIAAPPALEVGPSNESATAIEGDSQEPGSSWANPWDVSEPSILKPAATARDTYLDDIIIPGPEPFLTSGAETVEALLERPAPASAADQLADIASVRADFLRPHPTSPPVAEPPAAPSAALRQFESAADPNDRADGAVEEPDSPSVEESEIVAVRLPTRAESATLLALQADVARLRQQRETTDATLLAAKTAQERAARAASEAAAQARREADRRAEESAARAKEEAIAERKAREAAEKRAAEEAEKRAEAERLAREQAEQRVEAERRAREDAERQARLEAERRIEAERKKALAEAERKAKLEADARVEAERRKAREEAERLAREQAEQRIEAERRKAREEAERLAREQAEQRVEAERRAREEAERRAEAERLAREEAERRAKEETARLEREARERRAHADAERKAREAAEAHAAAERKAREIAERSAREQAERLARDAAREAVRKTQEEADQQARRTAAETDRMHKAAEARAREEAAAERRARQLAEQRAIEERKAREESERRAANDRLAREQAEQAAEAARAEASKPKKTGANRKSKKAAKPEPAAKVRKRRDPARSVQDEWGLYDPNAAGFEALFAKLESIENGEEERPAAARPMPRPLAMWAFQFEVEPAPVAAPGSKGHDEFRGLVSQFSIPHAVASVSYAKGARIRQIDLRELPHGAAEPEGQVVILSRRLLKEVRRQASAEVAGARR
jgi:hypothetical protein